MPFNHSYSLIAFTILGLGFCHAVAAHSQPHGDNVTLSFLTCAGLGHVNGSGVSQADAHMLRELTDAGFDFYTFMRSTRSPGAAAKLIGDIRSNHLAVGDLSDGRFIRMWFQIQLQPQLSRLSRGLLSCLSHANLSCDSLQALVMKLEEHKEDMGLSRQRMVYRHFLLPYLSRNSSGGCVEHSNSSGDWLMRNLQSFASFALFKDLVTLNQNFSALHVLDKLTPEQKAELILHPDMGGLDNTTIVQVLQSLLQPFIDAHGMNQSHSNTTTGRPAMGQANNNQTNHRLPAILAIMKPFGNFIQSFVSTVNKKNVSSMQSHVLTQVVVNWTLSELAGFFNHNYTLREESFVAEQPSTQNFNVTDLDDWFQHVLVPILKRFLPNNYTEALGNLTDIFNHVFHPSDNMDPEPAGPTEICKIDLSNSNNTCSVSETSEKLAVVLKCVANTNLNVTRVGIQSLVTGLLRRLPDHMMKPSPSNMSKVPGRLPPFIFSREQLLDEELVGLWVQVRLAPALPSLSMEYVSCLSNQPLRCKTYQAMVRSLSQLEISKQQQMLLFNNLIRPFLSRNDTQDPGCFHGLNDSKQWLETNLGHFASIASLKDLSELNRNFSALDALSLLSVNQLGELALMPGQLQDPHIVRKILRQVENDQLGHFFDVVSPEIKRLNLTRDVISVMLQEVFARANLSDPSVNDKEVLEWFSRRLGPLLSNMTVDQVEPFFDIIKNRDCNTTQQGVHLLNAARPTLMHGVQMKIQQQIVKSLEGPSPLRCYKNNSFFDFLQDSFLGFDLPKLTTILSVIPPHRKPEIINSFRPSDMGHLLRRPALVDNDTALCTVLTTYNRTANLLETEALPEDVGRSVLPCVWPLALAAEDESETDRWFEVRLRPYLRFLNKELLSSEQTLNATCLSFRKLVSFLGTNHSFDGSNFTKEEAYDTVKTYLSSDSQPKCYNPTDPRLNSTAWFVQYIGFLVNFVTSDDLDTFGSEDTLKLFVVNQLNIKLFVKNLNANATAKYAELIFLQNPSFNPLTLPPIFQCSVPGSAYGTLSQNDSLTILANLNRTCSSVDQEISSALAGNIKTVTADTISALGQESVGLSTAQITSAPPSVILGSLSTFSSVSGWNQGQLLSIINIIKQTFKFNNAANLLSLGTLIGGVPSTTFTTIQPSVALQSARNPTFITNMISAPSIVQQTFVKQIIKVNKAPQQVLVNVPAELAGQIPRNLLFFPNSGNQTLALEINKKKWKPAQAVLFFDRVAGAIEEPDNLSVEVLQGFTCSRIRTLKKTKVRRLIRACRRRAGRRKVVLRQTQLTCMYNFIKADRPTDFSNYASDMLLYFNYANIPKANCRSYFTQTGNADFTVLRRAFRGRRANLLSNARQCLGITGTKISRENVLVLGNMACTLDRPYIQNSDPEILEKMKGCGDITAEQASAVQTVLVQGNTKYGPPARWRERTLNELGTLPLYLSHDFWKRFDRRTTRRFLRRFMKSLRRRRTQKRKLKRLFKALTRGLRIKRAAECTVGNITRITIADDAFPFGYDATQFGHCITAQVVKDNLASLTEKVDDDDFQRVILDRLNEAFPSGLSDGQVQLLGSVSRVATTGDMDKWNISTPDTFAALMNSDDGEWEADKSKVIVTKFLAASNSLGSSELNIMGGANLCALDSSTLSSINSTSIQEADSLDISNCTIENKRALFEVAKQAFPINFSARTTDTLTSYQLIEPYLGGASTDYIRSLSSSSVSMDIETFVSLDEDVITALSVSEVSGLLGNNLDDLASYENETVIQNWISRQLQSDLDTLALGLTGGRVDATTASSNSTAAVTVAPNANDTTTTTTTTATTTTTTTTTTAATTTSAGNRGSSYSLLLIVLMAVSFIKCLIV